jgi:hypothetical protein
VLVIGGLTMPRVSSLVDTEPGWAGVPHRWTTGRPPDYGYLRGQPELEPTHVASQLRVPLLLSYDIELSFLPISRARPALSATQLSSARGREPALRHVHATRESAEVVAQALWQANFVVMSDRSEASETGKRDSLSDED